MFDLTQEIKLDGSSRKTYRAWQAIIYIGAFLLGMVLIFRTLFPTEYFTFSFVNFNSSKNTLTGPRNETGESKEKGKIEAKEKMLINASSVGKFSRAIVDLELEEDSSISKGSVSIKKSFQAFMYPEGSPLGFKDGTLLANQGRYYFVSGGRLMSFQNLTQVIDLGFRKEAFREVSQEEMEFNESGSLIAGYPESSLFAIQGEYYQIKGSQLRKFISEQAFLTQYDSNQAVEKDLKFLSQYPLAEELLGFSDGTLLAYADSVFIVNGKEILPVGDISIFEASGYDWSDLRKASGDEISLYEKSKIFPLSGIHPNGTVFATQEEGKYYLVQDGQKRLLPSENVRYSWSKQNPILVSSQGLATVESCQLKKKSLDWGNPNFICEIDISRISQLIGKDYEIELLFNGPVDLSQADVKLEKIINKENWEVAKSVFASRLRRNYD